MIKTKLPNWEIAAYVVYVLGGNSRRVHTEDIAAKCFEVASDTFSWVKYPQYPDKDVVRSALMDARKAKNGSLVDGRAGRGKGHAQRTQAPEAPDGWFLTEANYTYVERMINGKMTGRNSRGSTNIHFLGNS